MIVHRICNAEYKNDISGTGSKLYGSRWNSKGIPLLYTSEHISLAMLEMLVNTNFKDFTIQLELLYIQLPDLQPVTSIALSSLKKNWTEDVEYTRYIGDEIFKQKEILYIKVPSAVVQDEYNLLVNPLHSDFKKVKIINTKSFWPDKRLVQI